VTQIRIRATIVLRRVLDPRAGSIRFRKRRALFARSDASTQVCVLDNYKYSTFDQGKISKKYGADRLGLGNLILIGTNRIRALNQTARTSERAWREAPDAQQCCLPDVKVCGQYCTHRPIIATLSVSWAYK